MASEHPDEAPKRLSSDESLWGDQESKRKRGGPAFGVRVDQLPQEQPGGALTRLPKPSKTPDRSEPAAEASPPADPPANPPAPPASSPARDPRRRLRRVDLLIAASAIALLLVGFLVGAAVTRAGTEPPAAQPSRSVTVTSLVPQPAPPPRECLVAMERADAAIAYLVGNIRDQRLSDTIQEFVDSRRACQAAVR
jgi:hypothetical protein